MNNLDHIHMTGSTDIRLKPTQHSRFNNNGWVWDEMLGRWVIYKEIKPARKTKRTYKPKKKVTVKSRKVKKGVPNIWVGRLTVLITIISIIGVLILKYNLNW